MWSNAAYPSLKHLGGWVQDLELRCEFIQRWITHGVPFTFWLSGFFFPQGWCLKLVCWSVLDYSICNVLNNCFNQGFWPECCKITRVSTTTRSTGWPSVSFPPLTRETRTITRKNSTSSNPGKRALPIKKFVSQFIIKILSELLLFLAHWNYCFVTLSIFTYKLALNKQLRSQLPKIKDGVFIHGMYTDCFRFDTRSLKMANEKDRVMNERMPILHMKPELDFTPPATHYICPLYKTQARAGVLSTTGLNCFISIYFKLS